MRLRVIATALVTLGLVSSSAFAGGIGLFSAADGSSCNLNMALYVPANIYVLYLGQGGPVANGAEYKIAGMPGTFGVTFIATLVNAPNSNLNLGNAFDGVGHNVAFPAVQPFDGNGNLLLATYSMVALAAVPAGTLLEAGQRTPPTNALFPCPLITDVGFNLICQAGGDMRINGGVNCTVAVAEKTWTGVRNLYR